MSAGAASNASQSAITRLLSSLPSAFTRKRLRGKTGAAVSTIKHLSKDPTFKDLVEVYADEQEALFYDQHLGLEAISGEAINEILRRLEDCPEDFTVAQLLKVAEVGADRTGHGPQTSNNTNVNINVGIAQELEAARIRAMRGREIAAPKAVDITPGVQQLVTQLDEVGVSANGD